MWDMNHPFSGFPTNGHVKDFGMQVGPSCIRKHDSGFVKADEAVAMYMLPARESRRQRISKDAARVRFRGVVCVRLGCNSYGAAWARPAHTFACIMGGHPTCGL